MALDEIKRTSGITERRASFFITADFSKYKKLFCGKVIREVANIRPFRICRETQTLNPCFYYGASLR